MKNLNRNLTFALGLAVWCLAAYAAEDVVTAVSGTVKKVDHAGKTAVVATADGTEHTVHFVKKTAVHGASDTEKGSKDDFHGVKEVSEVVVHYSEKGGQKT